MKKFFLFGCTWLLCLLAGCTNDAFESETSVKNTGEPFTLYVNSSGADTRLAFDADGLNLLWENDDRLVLIDVEGQLDPIFLTTQLEAPATEAVFRSKEAVPAGRYFIRTVGNTLYSKEGWMQFGTSNFNWNTHEIKQPLQTLTTWNSSRATEKDFLYAPVINVAEGQFSGSVTFKHTFAMLKLEITGIELLTSTSYKVGMLCPTKAFPVFVEVNEDGSNTKILEESPKISLSDRNNPMGPNDLSGAFSLILPIDMTGQKVYIYISDGNGITYEIEKEGKNFAAGVCYTVKIDLNKTAKRIDISDKQLSTPEDFRALTFQANNYYSTFTITKDIDFSEEKYFPISLGNFDIIDGGGHTLKNLNIKWPFKEAGLIDCANSSQIKNLTLENVTVQGTDYVGAFCGNGANISNCKLTGNNTITGTGDYVGGIIGGCTNDNSGYKTLSSCEVNNTTTVSGKNYVGGMAGLAWNISDSKSAAEVLGTNYIGGIAGEIRGTVSESGSSAIITATGNEVGGIGGIGGATKCFFTGSVTGNNNVGGIVGNSYIHDINLCFSTGSIEGNSYVGGIVGISNGYSSSDIFNSYSLSQITGQDATTTAGILGGSNNDSWVQKCYFAGTLNNGSSYGISGSARINNCITTASKLGSNDSEADAGYVNLTSIQSKLSHINGDRVYSEGTVWKDYGYNCPLLLWQIPSTDTGGVTPPPFTEEEW